MLPGLSKEKTSEYMTEQFNEMLSPFNRWITGIKIGHSPSNEECMLYYILDGGSEDFERRWKNAEVHHGVPTEVGKEKLD